MHGGVSGAELFCYVFQEVFESKFIVKIENRIKRSSGKFTANWQLCWLYTVLNGKTFYVQSKNKTNP